MRFNALQDIIVELLDSLTISKARGFLLDDIGVEVGASRDEVDFGDYFWSIRFGYNQYVGLLWHSIKYY